MAQARLLEGKVALVTGAAGGQGTAICLRLAAEGADVLGLDIRPVPVLEEVRAQGRRAWELVLDLTDRSALRRELGRALESLPSLDVVVCAAGALSQRRLQDFDDEDWDRVVGVNMAAPAIVTQVSWPHLLRSAPSAVVHITSGGPRFPQVRVGPSYIASKGGLEALVPLFALEGAEHGIRVNGIAPGSILTPMSAVYYPTADLQARASPLGRIGRPDEIASAVAFLASHESSFMTGTILNVSGGKIWG
jgi:NAD(P)-dependent dehydrogenase (short-subunit alcohol dehydrogenase family)